jgi:hypothetical protein
MIHQKNFTKHKNWVTYVSTSFFPFQKSSHKISVASTRTKVQGIVCDTYNVYPQPFFYLWMLKGAHDIVVLVVNFINVNCHTKNV